MKPSIATLCIIASLLSGLLLGYNLHPENQGFVSISNDSVSQIDYSKESFAVINSEIQPKVDELIGVPYNQNYHISVTPIPEMPYAYMIRGLAKKNSDLWSDENRQLLQDWIRIRMTELNQEMD
jgi:hypothetical protein